MSKVSNKYLLLFFVLVVSFIYRMVLLHWQTFPPGADIGLHNSIVHSITVSGNTDLLWNCYQMGGGISLTFPGYHIFVSYITLMTGLPDYLVHSLVASFFSSLIVFCAYLLTRTIGGESVALIAAFLVAISRFDIEMLLWGGYPNVIALMLIPLTFYLFLQREKFSSVFFLVTSTILCGAIFVTHSLSAVIFVSVTIATILLFSISSRKSSFPKIQLSVWFLPLILGAILVSPFLVQVVPAYLGANSGAFEGAAEAIRLGLISTKVLPLNLVIPLLVSFPLFFVFSRRYRGKFLTIPAVLLALLILIPAASTQGYLVGFYTDFNRFLYFVVLPVIILIAFGVDHGARFFSSMVDDYLSSRKDSSFGNGGSRTLSRLTPHFTYRNLFSAFVLCFLLVSFLAVPIFLLPQRGVDISAFYQVMNPLGYEGIDWIREQTAFNSLFVSEAYYGWWISGFAQRATFSAVAPQYLTLAREFEPAKTAVYLLDADYVVDNGLIQVREDGGYIGRHNPMFSAKIYNAYEPYPFFHFNNSEMTVFYRKDGSIASFDLAGVPVSEMQVKTTYDYASISIRRRSQFFNFSQETTVYRGVRFVSVSIKVDSDVEGVFFDWIRFILHIKKGEVMQREKTVAVLDENMRVLGQLIFPEKQPAIRTITTENPSALELLCNLEGKPTGETNFYVGTYQLKLEETKPAKVSTMVSENLNSYLDKVADLPLDVFDYKQALSKHEISYIACRNPDVIPRFANDPTFGLVFINDDVAIFMVKGTFNQLGRPPPS